MKKRSSLDAMPSKSGKVKSPKKQKMDTNMVEPVYKNSKPKSKKKRK